MTAQRTKAADGANLVQLPDHQIDTGNYHRNTYRRTTKAKQVTTKHPDYSQPSAVRVAGLSTQLQQQEVSQSVCVDAPRARSRCWATLLYPLTRATPQG